MRLTALALCAAATLVAPAAAQTPEGSPDVLPDWLRMPTQAQLMAVFPTKAMQKGVDGEATIGCKVSLQGALFECIVLSEEPADLGFGQAAIALTPQFLMKPAMKDGQPVVGGVRIPISFKGIGTRTGSHISGGQQLMTRRFLGRPLWADAPSHAETAAAYPEKAAAEGIGGSATIRCALNEYGRLRACTTLSETPRGYGFAKAARALSEQFALAPSPDEVELRGIETQYMVTFDPAMLDPDKRVIGKPQWTQLPSAGAVDDGYPAEARAKGISGARVVINCVVGAGGTVQDCQVTSEEPAEFGFGQAALALAPHFRLSVWTDQGLPTVGGRITLPIRYELPPAADPSPSAGPQVEPEG
ncbi:MAG: energy transducer TonB [Phenylobacterium sp.]|uniref:energy transducer TonB n=1 Tax=Phenylobacterium sp. TaxID=1871053 RepID=UPI002730BB84|nr:energy transducer TonB [Phenylobacterium sp.]MDP1616049.1 energy transducer TonB [Phenylobacterium sp.]MDP1986862.1 energy transducer TonB [Phenylobacterium sp.]MDP3382927.1 energy transducer TonB [Phenylobacterium sp.]